MCLKRCPLDRPPLPRRRLREILYGDCHRHQRPRRHHSRPDSVLCHRWWPARRQRHPHEADRTELATRINGWISEDHPVTTRWITDEELDANPELVRTMFVKPPRGTGKVRLVLIGSDGKIDLQPCGGTHVKSTGEIGPVAVDKIQNKGKINRRIRLVLKDI
jgi:hypothetical protein